MKMIRASFKLEFKRLRISKKLSQRDVAEDLNVSQSLIAQWERGACLPNQDMIIQIADYFHANQNDLIGYDGEFSVPFPQTTDRAEKELLSIFHLLDDQAKWEAVGIVKAVLQKENALSKFKA
jgi:transcriptional regulator with XRE-family HTH domain